jgi:biopolymer transport protein ExbD
MSKARSTKPPTGERGKVEKPFPAGFHSRLEYERWEGVRERRKEKQKKRAEEGGISDLNITPMLDMMTIILVFLLKSFAASSESMSVSEDVRPPMSTIHTKPGYAVPVIMTKKSILVQNELAVSLEDGRFSAQDRQRGFVVDPLFKALEKEADHQKRMAEMNPNVPFKGQVAIIGDRGISYDIFLSVLYTAGQAEFSTYQLIVMTPND